MAECLTSSKENDLHYKGHSIFRGQPPYTHFNKSIEDISDILYLNLNDIDPHFLSENEQIDRVYDYNEAIDPRTNKIVTCALHDQTKPANPKLFVNSSKSSMHKDEHTTCLRVLQAFQEGRPVTEQDLQVWKSIQSKYQLEKVQMQKFIRDYELRYKEKIYVGTKILTDFYRRWYKNKVNVILDDWQDGDDALNTSTGLRALQYCSKRNMQMLDIKLVQMRGFIQVFQSNCEALNPHRMRFMLDKLFERGLGWVRETHGLLENNFEKEFHGSFKEQAVVRFCMPIDSLIFLHVVGEYVDYPTEMMLEIKEGSPDGTRIIVMESPWPSRNCGRYTNDLIVKTLYNAYTSQMRNAKWLRVSCQGGDSSQVVEEPTEIDGTYCESREYEKPQTFDEYLANYDGGRYRVPSKSNQALFRWLLQDSAKSAEPYEMLISMEMPCAVNDKCTLFTGPVDIKLEYKSEFGCEVLTKYELLKAWYGLTLLSGSGRCNSNALVLRLSSEDFHTELPEYMTLQQIEAKLLKYYNMKMPQVLGQLWKLLESIGQQPLGRYLLRYHPKFQEQLLLYSSANEIRRSTVMVTQLLNTEPSDMAYMTGGDATYQQIDDSLCSTLHRKHGVLPCAFIPVAEELNNEMAKKQEPIKNAKKRILGDEEYVAKRIELKLKAHLDKRPKQSPLKSAQKQRAKRKRRTALKAQKLNEQKELQREEEINQLLTE